MHKRHKCRSPKGRVIGDVQYNLLEMSIGARVDGKLKHKNEGALSNKDKEREG